MTTSPSSGSAIFASPKSERAPVVRQLWVGTARLWLWTLVIVVPVLSADTAAVTAIPGAVFSGSLDGGMRAYSTKDGSILWTFDTNKEFQTVNGVKANGGGIEGPGPIVAGGMLYFNSGYGGFVGNPGNVLLAFGID